MKRNSNALILRDDHIVQTVGKLQLRIHDRFPDSGLSKLCLQLLVVAEASAKRASEISNPIRWIRAVGYALAIALILLIGGSLVYAVQVAVAQKPVEEEQENKIGIGEFLQTLDSGLNDAIFIALAIFFLVSLENRIKRRRALAAVHELRSIAHVIDMHQLTKDPERYWREWARTENSPTQTMTPFQLNRYLDYCSEMLSLTSKIASLYIQHFDDADAVAAVSDVEQLTTGLSRKIWQKIMILEQTHNTLMPPDGIEASPSAVKFSNATNSETRLKDSER